MTRYLLSTHCVAGEVRAPMSDEEMRQSYARVGQLEAELRSAGAWVFGGRLDEPDAAVVVRGSGADLLTTDGPFVESKEHLGGFYLIDVADSAAAMAWAAKVTALINAPIEVRRFVG